MAGVRTGPDVRRRARACADGRGCTQTGADGRGRVQGVHAQAGTRADERAQRAGRSVTGLLVHAAAGPVRRSHISTKLRPNLTRHALGFILTGFALPWAHQESGSSSRPVCAG